MTNGPTTGGARPWHRFALKWIGIPVAVMLAITALYLFITSEALWTSPRQVVEMPSEAKTMGDRGSLDAQPPSAASDERQEAEAQGQDTARDPGADVARHRDFIDAWYITTLMLVLLVFAAFAGYKHQWRIMQWALYATIGVVVVGSLANWLAQFDAPPEWLSMPDWLGAEWLARENFTPSAAGDLVLQWYKPVWVVMLMLLAVCILLGRIARGSTAGSAFSALYVLLALAVAVVVWRDPEAMMAIVQIEWLFPEAVKLSLLFGLPLVIAAASFIDRILKAAAIPALVVLLCYVLVGTAVFDLLGSYRYRMATSVEISAVRTECLTEQKREAAGLEVSVDFHERCKVILEQLEEEKEAKRQAEQERQEAAADAALREQRRRAEKLERQLARERKLRARAEEVRRAEPVAQPDSSGGYDCTATSVKPPYDCLRLNAGVSNTVRVAGCFRGWPDRSIVDVTPHYRHDRGTTSTGAQKVTAFTFQASRDTQFKYYNVPWGSRWCTEAPS